MNRKHHCQQCGAEIDNPETGEMKEVYGTKFWTIVCTRCDTEHDFTVECDELQCHSTVHGIKLDNLGKAKERI